MIEFFSFFVVGFVAQLVDGALGMGFGVISSAVLLGQGVPPPLVSASVNAAKIPTGTVAALSHILNRNPDWRIVRRVAISGAVGGILGALMLSALKGPTLQILISGYLVLIGGLIIWRGIAGIAPRVIPARQLTIVGGTGGLIEGIGGSWGPIVTTALLGSGAPPRTAVGSSTVCELMVSVVVFVTLLSTFHLGAWDHEGGWQTVILSVGGLVCGGVPAAFLGGRLARVVPVRPLTFAVGVLALSIAAWRLVTLL